MLRSGSSYHGNADRCEGRFWFGGVELVRIVCQGGPEVGSQIKKWLAGGGKIR